MLIRHGYKIMADANALERKEEAKGSEGGREHGSCRRTGRCRRDACDMCRMEKPWKLEQPFSCPSTGSYRHMDHQFVDDDLFDMVLSVSSFYISLFYSYSQPS